MKIITDICRDQKSILVPTISMVLLAIILLLMLIIPKIALASVTVPDTLMIKKVDAYTGVKEDNDQLYIITYDIAYSGTQPDETSEDLFLIRLMSPTNAQLGVVIPPAYYNDGFSDGIAGIYFTAGQVDTMALTYGPASGYYMQIAGNPMIAWETGTPPSRNQITFANYYTEDIQNTLHTRLSVEVTLLQNQWSIDLIQGPSGERILTDAGQEYMTAAINNLRYICPSIFPAATSVVDMPDTAVVGDFFVGGDTTSRNVSGNSWLAQTFTASMGYELDRIAIKGFNSGTPSDLTVSLYDTSDGPDHLLTSGTISGTDFLQSPGIDWEECALTPYTLTRGDEYAIVLHCDSGTVSWRYDATSTYDGTAYASTDAGATWASIAGATFQFQTKAKGAFDMSYSTRMEHQLDGTVFDTSSSEAYLGLSSIWLRTLIWLVLACIVAVFVAMESQNSKPITPIILFFTACGYFIGMVDPMLALGLAALGGLLTIYMTLFNRASA